MVDRVLIIAEAGVNHNGCIETAKKLIDVAADAGADMVKFQTFKAENLVTKTAQKASYQAKNINDGDNSQFNMLKRLELSERDHEELIDYCNSKGIKFFSTAFDVIGLEYLKTLGFSVYKVPSGEITNYPYLKKIASFGKPVILSTGMANMQEVKEALEVLTSECLNRSEITVLHCNTEYPTPMKDVNLKTMNNIAKEMSVPVGYSDHTLGIEVPIGAVALGAKVIEKHFTLDRSLSGPDHKASLEPLELKNMVTAIRNIELAISGDGIKRPSESESKNISIARKSVYFSRKMKANEVIKEEDLIALRPGNGISPMKWNEVVGSRTTQDFPAFHQVKLNDFI